MKVTVFVSPKSTVLDPQGAAVCQAMNSLGFGAHEVRVGKTITFSVEAEDSPEIREEIDSLCRNLLANPVIEDYIFDVAE